MKKIIFIVIFLSIFISFGSAIYIQDSFVQVGKEVEIFGDGFGNSIGRGGICFNSESSCFAVSNPGIISWSDKLIKVKVPSNIALKGSIKIYSGGPGGGIYKGAVDYIVKPETIDISDGTYVKSWGGGGEKVLIQGMGFGSSPGVVFFGEYNAKIISRSENKIWLNLPDVKSITNKFFIQNKVGINSDLKLFNVYPKLSKDEYSYKQKYLNLVGVQDAWKNSKNMGSGIIVAVMDAGIKLDHPDLKNNLWTNSKEIPGNKIDDDRNNYVDDIFGWNFVDGNNNMSPQSDHGTMIAGIISAQKDNGIGMVGIAPKSKIMTLKVFDKSLKTVYNIPKALTYAVDNGAKIINLSFGSENGNNYKKEFDDFFKYAYDKGAVVLVAAGNSLSGNSKQDLDKYPNSPVCNDGGKNYVIGVTAVNDEKKKSEFAYFGNKCVDISAPGEEIFSTSDQKFNGKSDYMMENGTSFATPIVAGAIALLWSDKPLLKNTDIYQAIKESSDDIDSFNPNYKGKIGKFINVSKLIQWGNTSGSIGSKIDKKAMTMFINIQSQMKDYSQQKKLDTYKSIYTKLSNLSGNNLQYINDLKGLIEKEINR